MSKVLVAYATKMGSTKQIADQVGAVIGAAGDEVTVLSAQDVMDVDYYDAVVLGSALYMTRWRPDAVQFLRRFSHELARKPVWLFHSGPTGDTAGKPQKAPGAVRRLATAIGADQPITFGGRIEAATAVGSMARRMARGPLAGDYRDWDQIREWAADVARTLHIGNEDIHVQQPG